eukprot:6091248-Pyramimonas_sp.AAC.1
MCIRDRGPWAQGARCRRPAPPPRRGRAAWSPLREPRGLRGRRNGEESGDRCQCSCAHGAL